MQRTILYVDPDAEDRERFEEAAESFDGIDAITVGDCEDAADWFREGRVDAIISEASIGTDALDSLIDLADGAAHPVPCIILTDEELTDLLDEGMLVRASAVRSKDADGSAARVLEELQESLRPRSEIPYPVPEDEEERVKAANAIDIDTLREEPTFDRLAELARAFFDVKFAFVGIVQSDTEEFISWSGAVVATIDRDCSICTFGIIDDGTTVIQNSRTDARFKYIEELEELDIVFYAGHPITDQEGHRIGMFCITDVEPRTFDADDRHYLKLFAEEARERIERHGSDRR